MSALSSPPCVLPEREGIMKGNLGKALVLAVVLVLAVLAFLYQVAESEPPGKWVKWTAPTNHVDGRPINPAYADTVFITIQEDGGSQLAFAARSWLPGARDSVMTPELGEGRTVFFAVVRKMAGYNVLTVDGVKDSTRTFVFSTTTELEVNLDSPGDPGPLLDFRLTD